MHFEQPVLLTPFGTVSSEYLKTIEVSECQCAHIDQWLLCQKVSQGVVLNDCFASHRYLIDREPGPNYTAQGGDGNKGFFLNVYLKNKPPKAYRMSQSSLCSCPSWTKCQRISWVVQCSQRIMSYWSQQISSLCTSISCHKHCTISHYWQSLSA